MECPSCFELYDDNLRIPRNINCGHTYCEVCLLKLFEFKVRIECPECRMKLDPSIKPNKLSKNYVALDLARKQREIQNKLQFCPTHNEPYRYFCETDQTNVCPQCIIDHSGHFFVKQEHSVHILKAKIDNAKGKCKGKLEEIEEERAFLESHKNQLIQNKASQIKLINAEFSNIIKQVEERKEAVLKNYQNLHKEQMKVIDIELEKKTKFTEVASQHLKSFEKFEKELEVTKVITNEAFVKELTNLEEMSEASLKDLEKKSSFSACRPIKIKFDPKISNVISQICQISYEEAYKNPKINFFGEKNKILTYSIDKDEWYLHVMPNNNLLNKFEFSYYSSAATLPNGKIIITGGGISNAVYEISISNFRIQLKKPMKQTRKEHGSVYVNKAVYVLGGYDTFSSNFLSTCEKFNPDKNDWTFIKNMNIAKCAFAVTAVNNKYIFTFGGYDGKDRLNIIEKYDLVSDIWSIYDLKLPQLLSNGACFSPKSDQIIILGGGYNNGFSLEVLSLDLEKKTWTKLPGMTEGKDLRNKLVCHNNCLFAVGGNNYKAEKLSLIKNQWESLKSYANCYQDNLDSWSCALSFETEGSKHEEKKENSEIMFENSQANNRDDRLDIEDNLMNNENEINNYLNYVYDPLLNFSGNEDNDSHLEINESEEFDF